MTKPADNIAGAMAFALVDSLEAEVAGDVIAYLVPGGAETHWIPGLIHVLRRTDGPASVFSYRRLLRDPVDDDLLTDVARWLLGRLQ